jgi:hypothetical protein
MRSDQRCACGKYWKHVSLTTTGDYYRCCSCHIKAGGTPADWHDECMSEWRNKK